LQFANSQREVLDKSIAELSLQEPRAPLLLQIPGVGTLIAMTMLGAIGDIVRFPDSRQLVGFAGFGTRVHLSGTTVQTGRITKAGRKDLRHAMVESAQHAVRTHPHWHGEFARLLPRLGRQKAIIAIARKLLIVVWH